MRIGTWNIQGRRGPEQTALLQAQDCDVWLLTEVNHGLALPGYHVTEGSANMGSFKRWAIVASRQPLAEIKSTHPATAAATIDGVTYVSSVLPWAGTKDEPPWNGANLAARMSHTLNTLAPLLHSHSELVWGGDWNQVLSGPNVVGSKAGGNALRAVIDELRLMVPTAELPHRVPGACSIDHIALRAGPKSVTHIVAEQEGKRLSDHDMYTVEI